jgi:mono/diheme cytochrome c family protein
MSHNIRWLITLALGLVSVITLAACGPSAATPAPTVAPPTSAPTEAAPAAPTVAAAATTPAATGAQGTSEQQVAAGQKVYTTDCESCHGASLEGVTGPPLTQSTISRFGDAQQFENFIAQLMPLNAPGSLSQQQYYDVTAFILNKDGLLPAGETLTPDNVANIKLTK